MSCGSTIAHCRWPRFNRSTSCRDPPLPRRFVSPRPSPSGWDGRGGCDNGWAMRDELRDGDEGSLAWGLLFGLASSEPGAGQELGDAVGGDLVDDIDEIDVGVDADELAVEQDGEHVGVALARVEAADEQRVLPV